MKIEILGMGCAKCKQLTANAEKAVKELGIQAEVEKVEDASQIMAYAVMVTPAIVIDGEVKAAGKVLSSEEIKRLMG